MGKQRIKYLDILRGFAILGTLGTNIWIFANLGDVSAMTTSDSSPWWTSGDEFLRVLVLYLVNGKFLGMLAIMFGVGLQLKYEQSLRKGGTWPGIYVWASCLLFIEGWLHYTLVFEYDILMSYAVTAIIVAFIVKMGEKAVRRVMLICGGWHALIVILMMIVIIVVYIDGGNITFGEMREVTALYQQGTWFEQVQYRFSNFWLLRIEVIFVIPMNIFLFLLGVRLKRAGAFSADENGRRIRQKMWRIGLFIGIPLNLLIFVPGGLFDLWVRYFAAPFMAVGYMALIMKLIDWKGHLILWLEVEKIGRMALSCYVLQNILCTFLFYGWGLRIGGEIGSLATVMIWFGVCIIQMLFALLWLRYFKMGPLETVRKSLTRLPQGGRKNASQHISKRSDR